MLTTIQKWGNSKAVRLPKSILEITGMNENDKVELRIVDGNVIIVPLKKHKPLADRIAEYTGDYICKEWNTEKPSGNEEL